MRILLKACRRCNHPRSTTSRRLSIFGKGDASEQNSIAMQKAMADAEKIVGFPTSFLSLRALLNEDFEGLAVHVKKVINTRHPLLETAKDIVFNSKNYMQTRGLVALLFSKAANPNFDYNADHHKTATEIYNKQRAVAEISELIHVAFLVHRGIVSKSNIKNPIKDSDMNFGNRLAVLGGDFMLATASLGLAKLDSTSVVALISSAIRDMSTALVTIPEGGVALFPHQLESFPIGTQKWSEAIRLASGSLISNACHSALLLASHEKAMIDASKLFSEHMTWAWQARSDFNQLKSKDQIESSRYFSSLCSLPVAMMAEKHGRTEFLLNLTKRRNHETLEIDVEKLYDTFNNRHGHYLKSTNDLCLYHVEKALDSLNIFENSEAKTALESIALSVK